jgi:multidrug efflux pump subunit AcrA (membrane-fusion protein)
LPLQTVKGSGGQVRLPKKYLYAIAAVVVLLLLWWGLSSNDGAEQDIAINPTIGPFVVSVSATGELKAKNSTDIHGPKSARMVGIWQMKISKLIPEGTQVKKGQFVAEIDKTEISNEIKEVDIEIEKAESRFTITKLDTLLELSQARDNLVNLKYAMEEARIEKEQSIYEAPSILRQAEINYQKALRSLRQSEKNYSAKVKQAKAKIREIEAEWTKHKQRRDMLTMALREFTVLAPADGMVIYAKEWNGKKKTVNSNVSSWDPVVASLPDLSVMESLTFVNEVDIKKIALEQKVHIGLDADPDKKLEGKVTKIANIGEQRPNSSAKVFEVLIEVAENDSTLRPAMTTSNEIIISEVDSALFIPLECVHNVDSTAYVVIESGLSRYRQEVKTGIYNENYIIVEQGISVEDNVLLSLPDDADELSLEYLERQ